jgi:hypothetical protein
MVGCQYLGIVPVEMFQSFYIRLDAGKNQNPFSPQPGAYMSAIAAFIEKRYEHSQDTKENHTRYAVYPNQQTPNKHSQEHSI